MLQLLIGTSNDHDIIAFPVIFYFFCKIMLHQEASYEHNNKYFPEENVFSVQKVIFLDICLFCCFASLSIIFQSCWDWSSWVEPVLSKD